MDQAWFHRLKAASSILVSGLAVASAVMLLVAQNATAAEGLYVPNIANVAEFQGRMKNGKKPHRVNRSGDIESANAVAFDPSGNIWVTNFDGDSIIEFTRAQFKAAKRKHSAPSAIATISQDGGANLAGPEGIAFDSAGTMWVGSEHGQEVLAYSPSQYAASGNPTPNVILNANSFDFSSPSNVVFDSAGNLWVIDENIPNGNGGTGEIFRYNRSQVSGLSPGTHHIDPAFGIGFQNFVHLEGFAFDNSGNAWIADESTDSLYRFSASQLGGSGLSNNLSPTVTLGFTGTGGPCNHSIDNPYGVAVSSSGDLFVANAVNGSACHGSLAVISAGAINSDGNPSPRAFISNGAISGPGYLTFGPTP